MSSLFRSTTTAFRPSIIAPTTRHISTFRPTPAPISAQLFRPGFGALAPPALRPRPTQTAPVASKAPPSFLAPLVAFAPRRGEGISAFQRGTPGPFLGLIPSLAAPVVAAPVLVEMF